MKSNMIVLGIVAIIAILVMVFLFKTAITGKFYYHSSPEEACAMYTHMCEDGLPPLFTGNIDVGANLVECRCQTNPYHTGWRSMVLTYGRT
jgi:hypothetical protein